MLVRQRPSTTNFRRPAVLAGALLAVACSPAEVDDDLESTEGAVGTEIDLEVGGKDALVRKVVIIDVNKKELVPVRKESVLPVCSKAIGSEKIDAKESTEVEEIPADAG
jgi:hypothetical protein